MKGKLLIVDNNRRSREELALTLGLRGWQVRTAGNLNKAMTAVREMSPHVVIIDLDITDGDPFTLIRSLGGLARENLVKVIVTSRHPHAGALLDAYTAGADGFVSKPMDPKSLEDLLNGGNGRRGGFRLQELARRAQRLEPAS